MLLQFTQAKEDLFCIGLSRLSIQTRSRSHGSKFPKAESSQCCGPMWMSGLCSMCGKMAMVQGLYSFIFCESLEDNCFMHFTELLADWFNIHRASTVTDGGDNCKWERNIDWFLLFLTIWSHYCSWHLWMILCCYWQPYGICNALSTCFIMNATLCIFLWENQKPKIVRLSYCLFRNLPCFL